MVIKISNYYKIGEKILTTVVLFVILWVIINFCTDGFNVPDTFVNTVSILGFFAALIVFLRLLFILWVPKGKKEKNEKAVK